MLFAVPQGLRAQSTHTQSGPLIERLTPFEIGIAAEQGTTVERARSAKWLLAEHRRLSTALARVLPGRKGVTEAFVLSVALDSDPVFGREAREAGRVLTRRYAATGRSVTLGGPDGMPGGSPGNIAAVLARFAELMGPEDVLVLYTTSHGAPFGLYYNDGDAGYGVVGPVRLAAMLRELGIENRLLLISACYSGVFVGPLITPGTAIVTAASADRTSFGCKADNDWTFFGDAMINHALRKPQKLAAATDDAKALITGWETGWNLTPSQPQTYIGDRAKGWLTKLEATLPPATPMVGKPATDSFGRE
jgi:Peptidase C13 family